MGLLFEYLSSETALDARHVAQTLWRDYQRGGRRDKPAFLKNVLPADTPVTLQNAAPSDIPKRQARHRAVDLMRAHADSPQGKLS
jgi:hypothetical protein